MGGVVKGFHIACNLDGLLVDLTGRGDQPSGKEELVSSAVHVKGQSARDRNNKRRTHRGVLKLDKRVSLKSTSHYRK